MFHCLVIKVLCFRSLSTAHLSYHTHFCLSRTFLSFFKTFQMNFCDSLLISNSFTLSHSLPNVNKFFKLFIFFFVFQKRKIRLISKRIKVYHWMHSTSSSFLLFSKNYKLQKNCYWQFFLHTNIQKRVFFWYITEKHPLLLALIYES